MPPSSGCPTPRAPAAPGEETPTALASFAARVFRSLPRADQRRWAEVYLRGLLHTEGRKSVSRMTDGPPSPRVTQSLQQFVNQSPWEWAPIRGALAHEYLGRGEARAWVVGRVVIPKSGSHSVGVARRFVAEHGRVVNCQIGVALFLVTPGAVGPVTWRLLLGGKWDHDADARERVHLPDGVRGRAAWAETVSLVDEASRRWGLPPAPLVATVAAAHAPSLAGALRARGVDHVLGVDAASPGHVAGGLPISPSGPTSPGPPAVGVRTGAGPGPTWLTSLSHGNPAADVPRLAALTARVARATRRLESDFGLRDFEGRSFRGWHHHMTMVSAAWAYSQLHGQPHGRSHRPPDGPRGGSRHEHGHEPPHGPPDVPW
ncbi:IS701 family transposase [Streptomyces sp. 4N509B]|uniref:IS701 family transposase n=1 Tax=Streptomyces sp. 4N509B TaxID=3457413 RepID=UPI003FD61580